MYITINTQILLTFVKFFVKFLLNELFLIENFEIEINFNIIVFRLEIALNKEFDDILSIIKSLLSNSFMRCVLEQNRTIKALNLFSSLNRELEIDTYNCKYLVKTFALNNFVILLSLLAFINKFELYKNIYRLLLN